MSANEELLTKLGAEPVKAKRRKRREPSFEEKEKPLVPLWLRDMMSAHAGRLVASVVVLILTSVVVVNAVYLQRDRHPAPYFVTNETDNVRIDRTTTAVIPQPASREIILRTISQGEVDPVVRKIQEALAVRGYYDAAIDGLLGARTKAAIGLYQRTFGQEVTHTPNSALLQHISLSPEDPVYHTIARGKIRPNPLARSNDGIIQPNARPVGDVVNNKDQIKQVQNALTQLGFGTLQADGIVGPQTRAAVRAFERHHGLEPTGQLSVVVVNHLARSGQL